MKKTLSIFLSYLLITFNSFVFATENNNKDILKIGVLAPFSGELKFIGETILYSINLALHDINDSSLILNGVETPPLSSLLSKINWENLSQGKPVIFHGDFEKKH